MKFKSHSTNPAQWAGVVTPGPKQVVPNMSLSLQEILERFTRGEPLEIGKEYNYDDQGDDDLEKVKHMDLVDREEYVNKLKQTRKFYDAQQKARAEKRQGELDKKAVEELVAAKLAAEKESKVIP